MRDDLDFVVLVCRPHLQHHECFSTRSGTSHLSRFPKPSCELKLHRGVMHLVVTVLESCTVITKAIGA